MPKDLVRRQTGYAPPPSVRIRTVDSSKNVLIGIIPNGLATAANWLDRKPRDAGGRRVRVRAGAKRRADGDEFRFGRSLRRTRVFPFPELFFPSGRARTRFRSIEPASSRHLSEIRTRVCHFLKRTCENLPRVSARPSNRELLRQFPADLSPT